jgi:hypothetical protein
MATEVFSASSADIRKQTCGFCGKPAVLMALKPSGWTGYVCADCAKLNPPPDDRP